MAASLLADVFFQLCDGNGNPYPGWKLFSFVAGTSTPLSTFSDVGLTIPNANPTVADADGRVGPIFCQATSYKWVAKTSADVVVVTRDNWLQPGDYFASNFGVAMAVGSRNVSTGYTVLLTDRLVTVASSGATTVNLPLSSTFTMDVTIKNMLTGTVVLTPNGADLVDGLATFTLEAAGTPVFPAVTLRPVTGGWLIVSSHRVA